MFDVRRQRLRVAAFLLLLIILGGLLVGAGTITADPTMNNYPDEEDVAPNPDSYVGAKVILGGTVVGTDPVTVEVEPETGDSFHATFENVDQPLAIGDDIVAFGTLRGDSTLAVDRAVVREPWEFHYMYLVSFVGGLWVLLRIARHWRIDTDRLALTPREDGDA